MMIIRTAVRKHKEKSGGGEGERKYGGGNEVR